MSLVTRLRELVSFDTQNPSGDERPMAEALAKTLGSLGASAVETFTAENHHAVYARFGDKTPRLLVNAHIDTVPANSGYSDAPLALRENNGRLVGLGSADTKGAIAAILEALAAAAAAGKPARDVAVLFSGDEEKSNAIMRAFLSSNRVRGLERAIVCEPTGNRIGTRHRGIAVAEVTASSAGGHSSLVDSLPNPIVVLSRIAVKLDELAKRHRDIGPPGFKGICLNVASIDGGVAFNVIPTQARLLLSFRPAPGTDLPALFSEIEAETRRAASPEPIEWKRITANPAFETRDLSAFEPLLGDRVPTPIDLAFWTEAALISAHGIDAVVFGPGRIEQAHAADEYVEVRELQEATEVFTRIFCESEP